MKSYLWSAALLLAAMNGVLCTAQPARADSDEPSTSEQRQQAVLDAQIKYASYGVAGIILAVLSFWALGKANQGKKKYIEDLKKQDRLDPNEGMPIN